MKALLVDDEEMNLYMLEKYLKRYPVFKNIYQHTNPFTAYEEIKIIRPDVVFMDIEMPGMNGLELAQKIMEYDSTIKVVFITSYDSYAFKAFEVYAIDYILKPISFERLDKTVMRLLNDNFHIEVSEMEKKLEIKTFGTLEVLKGIKHVKWNGPKTEELFSFLLSNYNKSIHKDIIIDTFWPECDYNRALANMQTAMYRVRKSLNEMGEHVQIEFNCNTYRLTLKNVEFDLLNFTKAIQEINEITDKTIGRAKIALELYVAPFLEQNGYLWSYAKQTSLDKSFNALLTKTVNYLCQSGRDTETTAFLKKLRNMNPTNRIVNDLR